MRVIALVALLAGGMAAIGLSGCGSSSYPKDARASVAALRRNLSAYNATPQTDVPSTAAACVRARDALRKTGQPPAPPSSGPDASLGRALRRAYELALAGFNDCGASAPYGFLTMVRAQREVAAANAWLDRARALER